MSEGVWFCPPPPSFCLLYLRWHCDIPGPDTPWYWHIGIFGAHHDKHNLPSQATNPPIFSFSTIIVIQGGTRRENMFTSLYGNMIMYWFWNEKTRLWHFSISSYILDLRSCLARVEVITLVKVAKDSLRLVTINLEDSVMLTMLTWW